MKFSTLTLLAAAAAAPAFAQTVVEITDADLVGGETYDWNAGDVYVLNGLVYLEAGGTLNIPAGTALKFRSEPDGPAAGNNTSALIITPGAQIFADGTADAPIIMTAESDDLNDASDFEEPEITRGLWGGLILLGKGTLATDGSVDQIEGIATSESRAAFGGGANPDDTTSSGRLKYVSIRHGGKSLTTDNEINGLTLGGVGSGTEIDYIEVFANDDDGIEIFGGAVDVKHASIAFCADDSYDYDTGWQGRGQFWFSLNASDVSGRGGEFDGADPDGALPFSNPTVANGTWIGSGADLAADTSKIGGEKNDFAVVIRDGSGGKFYNSVFTDFTGKFLNLEDLPNGDGVDSYQRLTDGDITLAGNIVGSFGDVGDDASNLIEYYVDGDQPEGTDVLAAITARNKFLPDSQLVAGISRTPESKELDPRPAFGSALLDSDNVAEIADADAGDDDFFEDTDYVGAFAGGDNTLWIQGWTALSTYGFLTDQAVSTKEIVDQSGVTLSPNPTSGEATLSYSLLEGSKVSIGLFDVEGRMIRQQSVNRAAGQQRSLIETANLPTGTYLVRLVADKQVVTKRLFVTSF